MFSRLYIRVLFFLATACLATSQSFGTIEYLGLNYVFSGSTPAGSGAWATVKLQDGLAPHTVRLTFDTSGLAPGEFISNWYLNTNPAYDPPQFTFTLVSNPTGLTLGAIQTGADAFKADGDGQYDVLFAFPSSGTGQRLVGGMQVVVDVSRPAGLSVSDFLFQSTPDGGAGTYYSAAHIQNIGSNSGWVGANTPTPISPIPEPSAYAAVLGILALLLSTSAAAGRPIHGSRPSTSTSRRRETAGVQGTNRQSKFLLEVPRSPE